MMMMSASAPPPMYTVTPFVVCRPEWFPIRGTRKPRLPTTRTRVGADRQRAGRRRDAAPWNEEGNEASPAVRAHKEVAAHERVLRIHGRGDRGPDGQQGACADRRGENVLEAVPRGHLVGAPRRPSQSSQKPARTHARSALRGSQGPQHPRALEDDEGRAPARARRTLARDVPRVSRAGSTGTCPSVIEVRQESTAAAVIDCAGADGAEGVARCVDLAFRLGNTKVVVDLGGRDGADAELLGVLHRSARRMREAGGRLAVVSASSRYRRVPDPRR